MNHLGPTPDLGRTNTSQKMKKKINANFRSGRLLRWLTILGRGALPIAKNMFLPKDLKNTILVYIVVLHKFQYEKNLNVRNFDYFW